MGRRIPRMTIRDRLSPLIGEMTAERFAKLVRDVSGIEAACKAMALLSPRLPIGGSDEPLRTKDIRLDIARRLRGICSHCTESEFLELVECMVRAQLRGESQQNLLINSFSWGINPT